MRQQSPPRRHPPADGSAHECRRIDRRRFVRTGASAVAVGVAASLPLLGRAGTARAQLQGVPFDRDWLVAQAKSLSLAPFSPPEDDLPDRLRDLDWDSYRQIEFRPERALWREDNLAFRIQFYHPGYLFRHRVAIHEVVDGQARPIAFDPDMFRFGSLDLDREGFDRLGFAGFRVHYFTDFEPDMVVFLGASYFRAVGAERQFGISARGLAIDTARSNGEEFPMFRAFWLERPAPGQTALRVHALLDSASLTGAYSFVIEPGRTTVTDVTATLFPRQDIEQLGVAPLTSMYLVGENDRRMARDFRPEIHDSDGLFLQRGNGEWLWRPLQNPRRLLTNVFVDDGPRGFGLLQRDRNFENYQDDGAYYDRRPNLWVVPRGDWGKGAVRLIEIPTDQEIFDNIVAFWTPEGPVEAGSRHDIGYRLHWGAEMPDRLDKPAKVIATRIGIGGIAGQKPRPNARKFVIDFVGGDLDLLSSRAKIEPVITASRGTVTDEAARPIRDLNGWRAHFDLEWSGSDPIDLRCFLRYRGSALSETWNYQWLPPA